MFKTFYKKDSGPLSLVKKTGYDPVFIRTEDITRLDANKEGDVFITHRPVPLDESQSRVSVTEQVESLDVKEDTLRECVSFVNSGKSGNNWSLPLLLTKECKQLGVVADPLLL